MTVNTWGDGHTWGDGATWGGSAPSSTGKLWQFKFDVATPHYRTHHASHKADHDQVPGAEGTYLKANKVSVRHFKGDTSGGTDDVMMNDGSKTFRRERHHSSLTNAVNSDSSLVHAPISGMRINTDGSIGGLPASAWTLSNGKYSAGTGFSITADVKLGSSSANVAIAIGNPSTNAIFLDLNNGVCQLYKVVAGTQTTSGTPTVNNSISVLTATYYRMRLAVDFAQTMAEAVIEDPVGGISGVAYLQLPFTPSPFPSFPNSGVHVGLFDSTGTSTFNNLRVIGRDLYLNASLPYQHAVQPNAALSGLDIVPDGVSRFAVASVTASNYPNICGGGTTGTQFGSGGPTFRFGTGAPATGLGSVGDFYFRTDGAAATAIYIKTGTSTWSAVT